MAGWSPRAPEPKVAKLDDLSPPLKPPLLCRDAALLKGDTPAMLPPPSAAAVLPLPANLVTLPLLPRSFSLDPARAFRLSANGEKNGDGGVPRPTVGGTVAAPLGSGGCPTAL